MNVNVGFYCYEFSLTIIAASLVLQRLTLMS